MAEKKCTACGLVKSTSDFPPRADTKDGLQPHCRACKNAWNRSPAGKSAQQKYRDSKRAKYATCCECGQSKKTGSFRHYGDGRIPECVECESKYRRCTVCWQRLLIVRFREKLVRRKLTRLGICMLCERAEKLRLYATSMPEHPRENKRCTRCKTIKPPECFGPCKARRDGLHSWCRDCLAENARLRRERADVRYRQAQHAKTPRARKYRSQYSKRPERKKKRREYEVSPAGRESRRRVKARRRMLEKSAPCDLTAAQWAEILAEHDHRCVYCKRSFIAELKPTQDHVMPISRGGHHTKDNVVPACLRCNQIKSKRTPDEVDPNIFSVDN